MTKTKGLILLIIILLVSNLVAWFMLYRDKGNKSNRKTQMREYLIKEVGFNDAQVNTFDSLSAAFRETIRSEMETTRTKKMAVMKEVVAKAFSDSAIAAGAREMAAAQQPLEVLMLRQAAQIRDLCSPAQLPAFDAGWEKFFYQKRAKGKKRSGG